MATGLDIVCERRGRAGWVTLNRPAQLNSLTRGMCRALHRALDEWASDQAIALVVVTGAGERAFCAGGDVRAIHAPGLAKDPIATQFFWDEYRLNAAVQRFPKPYVALVDGIVMGGGVGISVHGSHRVVTETTLFAMPETGIGLFPDVGGTYVLPRMPGEIGMYLGLTGERLQAADLLYAGYATQHVPRARLKALADALAGTDGRASVEAALAGVATDPGPPPLAEHRATIDRVFAADSVEEILARLERDGGDFARRALAGLRACSPTSLKLTQRQIRAGAGLDFAQAMGLEYRLVRACLAGHDFYEGVRGQLIDKDRAPKWCPARLADVTDEMVAAYFAPRAGAELALD